MATSLPSLRDSKVNARSEVGNRKPERKGGVKGDSSGWKPKIGGKEISGYRSQDTARTRAGCDGMNKFPGRPSCKVN